MDDDPAAVDDYIAAFSPDVQARLRAVREAIREAASDATEGISYGIPTFYVDGHYLVYLAGLEAPYQPLSGAGRGRRARGGPGAVPLRQGDAPVPARNGHP